MNDDEVNKLLDGMDLEDFSDDDSVEDPNYVEENEEDNNDKLSESDDSTDDDNTSDKEPSPSADTREDESLFSDTVDKSPIEWRDIHDFEPRFSPSSTRSCTNRPDLSRNSCALDIFSKLFPNSLLIHITHCANQSLKIHAKKVKKRHYSYKHL